MRKFISISIILFFLIVLLASLVMITHHHKDSVKQNAVYEELIETVESVSTDDEVTIEFEDKKTMYDGYSKLYERNNDMVGWIKIDGTKLNYPVMQSIDNPDFYLKHGFDKEYTDYGCPYVQENCDVLLPSDNIVIYGHNMDDGSMFATLENYKSKSFWSEHKKISFDTLTSKSEYEIVAVFTTTVYSDDRFKYYEFTCAEEKEDFDNYISKCKELSLYDTGVKAEYGDKLISLSTCEYSNKNGRIVVVAKRIS